MIALIKNEFTKLFSRKSSWIMQIVLFAAVLTLALLMFSLVRLIQAVLKVAMQVMLELQLITMIKELR